MNRRDFLKGCATFSALAATRGFGITNLVFANSTPLTTYQLPITHNPSPSDP
ncbi:MAG: twin-arginine translocation signal domain-containing protein [Anaerolineae bacterium]|nr:twin-arginine translocation signal domain-containing protein [Anaerolineae bacterium]